MGAKPDRFTSNRPILYGEQQKLSPRVRLPRPEKSPSSSTEHPMRQIKDMVFVITDATSETGRGLALQVTQQGGKVVLAAKNKGRVRGLAVDCQRLGSLALPVTMDGNAERANRRLAREAHDVFGRIDAWINPLPTTSPGRFFETPSTTDQQFIEATLLASIHSARAILPYFRRQGRGVLINQTSVPGEVDPPGDSLCAADSSGIRGWAQCLRMELRDSPDIHVSTLMTPTFRSSSIPAASDSGDPMTRTQNPRAFRDRVIKAVLECALHPKPEVKIELGRNDLRPRLVAPRWAKTMADSPWLTDQPEFGSERKFLKPRINTNGHE